MTRKLHGLCGSVHGAALSPQEWTAIEALYERVWPGMPARLRHAEVLGARWAECTTPFSWFEDGRAVATVGVLEHPIRLAGADTVVAGVHAVATDPDFRGRGLCRQLMQVAIAWAAPRLPLMELSTATPAVYTSSDFALCPTYEFEVPPANASPIELRLMDLDDPADLVLLRRRALNRAPVSEVYATREPGWMTIIDACLARVTARWFYDIPALDAVLVAQQTEDGWAVHDLITTQLPERLPPLEGRVTLWFAPDKLAANATAVPLPTAEFMRHGPWPALPPFGVPALWEH